mmetsp:Transcript_8989/g.22848  ORF Transcript_8989/g.22848 Transcript_8989/m.22848 type:complete len:205 (-) Transcript_8989:560-1174(-)
MRLLSLSSERSERTNRACSAAVCSLANGLSAAHSSLSSRPRLRSAACSFRKSSSPLSNTNALRRARSSNFALYSAQTSSLSVLSSGGSGVPSLPTPNSRSASSSSASLLHSTSNSPRSGMYPATSAADGPAPPERPPPVLLAAPPAVPLTFLLPPTPSAISAALSASASIANAPYANAAAPTACTCVLKAASLRALTSASSKAP